MQIDSRIECSRDGKLPEKKEKGTRAKRQDGKKRKKQKEKSGSKKNVEAG